MPTRQALMLTGVAIAFAAAGCSSKYQEPENQTPVPNAPAVPAATAPSAVPDQPNETGADLGIAQSADHGKYLVDATGKTLYLLEKDSNGSSTCYDACSTEWPPLLAPQGAPKALDPAIQAGAIATTQRTDGGIQVTYNGHPLYHYAKDAAAGQLNGEGAKDQFGEWYLVTPAGDALDSD